MPDYTVSLTTAQVDDLRDFVIKQMPAGTPKTPKEFLEWLVAHNLETEKRRELQTQVDALTNDELETLLAAKP